MGVLNVAPDSFYDGGRYVDENSIIKQTEKILLEGATIIDVGGYSSRPGASDLSQEEEQKRVIPTIQLIKKHFDKAVISIDSFRSAIVRQAVDEGAQLVNDISGGELDDKIFSTVSELKVPYICMHMKGTPAIMKSLATYDNMLYDIISYFHQKISALHTLGVRDVIIDPGFGFAKTVEQNFLLLNSLEQLHILEKPLLVGLSRKSMIWKTLDITPDLALNGTTALNMAALIKGATIIRVHDVKEGLETIKLFSNLSPAHNRV